MHLLLPYILILIILLNYILRSGSRKQAQKESEFWQRENDANSVRRKDISNLDYITIPDNLPLVNSENVVFSELYENNSEIKRSYDRLQALKDKKILNLTGFSNTDLKLEYGVANLTALSEYDDNFTSLVRELGLLGHELIQHDDTADGVAFLEYAVKIGSDVRQTYFDLIDYYKRDNRTDSLEYLKQKASILKSLNKDLILAKLSD